MIVVNRNILKGWLIVLILIGCLLGSVAVVAAEPISPDEIFLWPGNAPGSENVKLTENVLERSKDPNLKDRAVLAIAKPSIIPVLPKKANGVAVLICPGGAYQRVVADKEGYDVANWLNSIGVTAFILKYRLPAEGHQNGYNVPLQDAQRALRLIRKTAAQWGINPQKIGVAGFSAGGHVAATLGTQYGLKVYNPVDETDAVDARPNFMILMYPVISMKPELTHTGSRDVLIGKTPAPELVERFSAELHVDANTPPAFIGFSYDDTSVPHQNEILFYEALEKAKIPSELHGFRQSGHGYGIRGASGSAALWPKLCEEWMISAGIISK